jgi:hypothetical protein
MQSTLNELYGEIAELFPTRLVTTQTVTITSGAGTFGTTPFIIRRVRDTGNSSTELQPITLEDLDDRYPLLDSTGNPAYYYQTALATINTYPTNTTTLKVYYIPNPITLTTSTTETQLFIPAPYQEVLMWGALRLLMLDERDKAFVVSLQAVSAMYDKLSGDLKEWAQRQQVGVDDRVRVILG